MDIPRPSQAKAKQRKRLIAVGSLAAAVAAVAILAARISPAVPTVDRNLVMLDTAKRGPMIRQVRGPGTLLPIDIRWIAARTQGRVEKIVLLPGALVEPDSVILVLSNPDVTQAAADAQAQFEAAQAELTNLKVQLQRDVLQAESDQATAEANFKTTQLTAQLKGQMFSEGLISALELRFAQVNAEQASILHGIAGKRYAFAKESVEPQLQAKAVVVAQLGAQAKLKLAEVEALNVRAGMRGILQMVPVEVGAQVAPGGNLARVADPARLKAEIQIAETQAKDIQIGQGAEVDTRNGLIHGQVSRVAPSVQNGTVAVDIALGELPQGARPDLSVDGVIELERLENVVYVGRPAFGQDHASAVLFRLDPNGLYADRTQVVFGRSSVTAVEIVQGLNPGDRVILSDMSQWDTHARIRLN